MNPVGFYFLLLIFFKMRLFQRFDTDGAPILNVKKSLERLVVL